MTERSLFGLLRVVAMLPLATMLIVALVTTGTLLVGWTPTVVTSGSMAPLLRPGDILLAEPASPAELEAGQVVIFDADYTAVEGITHRLIRQRPSGRWVTKGDANATADPRPVAPRHVTEIVRAVIPRLGLPALWVRRGNLAGLTLLFTVIVVSTWGTVQAHQATVRRRERGS